MAEDDAPIALVTGASRGIGRATARALAVAGYDVVVAARTVHEGDGRMMPGSVRDPQETRVVEGSLESTAASIESIGRRALPVRIDLLDRASIDAMVDTVLGEWGRVDALVNNAIYQGPGRMDRVLELDLDAATNLVVGNYVNQLHLIQLLVPHMLERGGGRIVNLASATATMDPPAPAGEGGWGLGYGASKAAFLRVAGQLHVEFGERGLLAFNVDPSFSDVVDGLVLVDLRRTDPKVLGRYMSAESLKRFREFHVAQQAAGAGVTLA